MIEILKRILRRPLALIAILFLTAVPGRSQESGLPVRSLGGESTDCRAYLSTYRQFFLKDYYQYAIDPWRELFSNCPDSSERMYVDGVVMYRSFIEETPDGPVREGLIDTLMLIYDRRMEYFGGEGNIKGRKGEDLFNYRRGDPDQVERAYELLNTSISLQGDETRESVLVYYLSAGLMLYREGKIGEDRILEDYILVTGTLDSLKGSSQRRERTREAIDEMMQKGQILSCETLDRYYTSRFEQNREDEDFLNRLIRLYVDQGCGASDIFVAASESLLQLNPGPVAAHDLALLFISRNDLQKASGYLDEALKAEDMDPSTRAAWYYERGVVRIALDDPCGAAADAREAIRLKPDEGKFYILLGDAYISSRGNLGEEFQRKAAFWAAADQYRQAALKDPSVAEEAGRKLQETSGRFPDEEDIFFMDLKEGNTYRVGGCINESTKVRASK
jgi:hypothetical protein